MAPITYREADEGDIPEIRRVAAKAWGHTYRGIYSPARKRRSVQKFYSPGALQSAIRRAKNSRTFFLLAFDGEELVGYANGGRIGSPWLNPSRPQGKRLNVRGWELYRIYLLPDHIGKGVGRSLLDRWEEFLRKKGAKRYFVSYVSSNKLAGNFYRQNGFVRADAYDAGDAHCAVKAL